jgi:guanine deaminase
MDKDEKFMKEAFRLAKENIARGQGGPFGAVIVKDGKIIARGANAVVGGNDPTAHAEIVAIRKACKVLGTYHLDTCEIYTSCEPCPMCMGAIYWARIPKLYYAATGTDAHDAGFDDVVFYNQMILPYPKQNLQVRQLLREDARRIFEDWNHSENKKEY